MLAVSVWDDVASIASHRHFLGNKLVTMAGLRPPRPICAAWQGFGKVLFRYLLGLGRLLVSSNGLIQCLTLGFSGHHFRTCGGQALLQGVAQGTISFLREFQDMSFQARNLLAEVLQTQLLQRTLLNMSRGSVVHGHIGLHLARGILDRTLAGTAFLGGNLVLCYHGTRSTQRRPLTRYYRQCCSHARGTEPAGRPGTQASAKALGTHMFHLHVLRVKGRLLGELPLLLQAGLRGHGCPLGGVSWLALKCTVGRARRRRGMSASNAGAALLLPPAAFLTLSPGHGVTDEVVMTNPVRRKPEGAAHTPAVRRGEGRKGKEPAGPSPTVLARAETARTSFPN